MFEPRGGGAEYEDLDEFRQGTGVKNSDVSCHSLSDHALEFHKLQNYRKICRYSVKFFKIKFAKMMLERNT